LYERTNARTIPQIFIGGQHIGGATELFDACKRGEMQKLLEQHNVSFNREVDVDPYTFLPGWLQSR
jgi:cysteine synthase A